MHACRIALVAGQTIARPLSIELQHLAVASDLGDDRRGADRRLDPIATDDGPRRHVEGRAEPAIDEHPVRPTRQGADGAGHRQQGRVMNVQVVDLLDLGAAQGPAERLLADHRGEHLATLLAEFLRVHQAGYRPCRVEYDRGGDHRSGQGTASDLVDATDQDTHARRSSSSTTVAAARRSASCLICRWTSV